MGVLVLLTFGGGGGDVVQNRESPELLGVYINANFAFKYLYR